MLESLLPVSAKPPRDAESRQSVGPLSRLPARPSWLTPVRGTVHCAFPLPGDRSASEPRRVEASAARAEGKRFERRVLRTLRSRFPFIQVEPGFRFIDDSGLSRVCFPDAVLRFNDRTVVIEIKRRGHQAGDAWWQLERYYRPVLQAVYPMDPILCVAIVGRIDPAVLSDVPEIEAVEDAAAPFSLLEWR